MQRIQRVYSFACLFLLMTCAAQLAAAQSAWQPWTAYAVGNQVSYQAKIYSALQAHTSEPGWEPAVTPALWALAGAGSACSSAPSSPQGLTPSGTTTSGVTLSWTAPTMASGCSVSGYTVYRNGTSVGTTTGTSYAVGGLSAATAYSFTVAASNDMGMSPQSSAVNVTTAASDATGCAAAWSSTAVYTAGMTANVNGVNYLANYWTQGQNPATNNGPSGSGQPWTSLGSCSSCTTVPSVPTGLSVSSKTSSSVTLNWNASSTAANCTLSGYTVYRSGTVAGTATGTSYTVGGLSPSTAYSFTVRSNNEAGSSANSAAVNATTNACTGSCTPSGNKVFAPYIDMGLSASQQLVTIQQQSGIKSITLAFLVSGGCSVGWGGLGGTLPQDSTPNGSNMQTLIQQLQAAGTKVIISIGGANGQGPAGFCSSASSLQAVYQSIIDRYKVSMLDFDIEGGSVSNQAAITRRNQALVGLKAANPGLVISYTLPVLPTGLVQTGVNILNSVKTNGLSLDVVNVMAMDYGSGVDNGGQMGLNATLAASNTRNQVLSAGLSAKIGVTPMVGVNDVATEVFTLSDAQTLLNFARSNSYIDRLGMWSLSRDNGSCAGAGYASPVCSGISQTDYAFSRIFVGF